MLGRDGAGVEEGRVEEGIEQQWDVTRHGRSEGKGRKEASGGGIERRREGAMDGGRGAKYGAKEEGGRKGAREGGNLQGRYHEEDIGRSLPLILWYYK